MIPLPEPRARRAAASPLAGLAFVACFAAGAALYGNGAGSSASEIAGYYARHGERLRQIGGFAVVLAAVLFLLLYVVALRRALEPGLAADVVLAAGICLAALLAAADALWAASAFTVELEDGYRIDPRTHLILEDAGFALFVAASAFGIPLVAAASLGRAFPRWFAWTGVPVAAALAAAYWYVPFFALLAWVGVGSVLLARLALQAESRA